MSYRTCVFLVLGIAFGSTCCDGVPAQSSVQDGQGITGKPAGTACGVPRRLAELLEELHDQDCNVRVKTLVKLSKNVKPLPQQLIDAVGDASVNDPVMAVRLSAIYVLAKEYSVRRLDFLKKALCDEEPSVRAVAAIAVGNYGEKASPIIPELLGAWDKKENEDIAFVPGTYRYVPVKYYIADAIGEIGPTARIALPKLVQTMKHKDKDLVRLSRALVVARHRTLVRLSAALAVIRIKNGDNQALKVLTDELSSDLASIRYEAVYDIARAGPLAKPALGDMIEAFYSEDSLSVRACYMDAFGSLGIRDEGVLYILRQALHEKHRSIRNNAAEALEELKRQQ